MRSFTFTKSGTRTHVWTPGTSSFLLRRPRLSLCGFFLLDVYAGSQTDSESAQHRLLVFIQHGPPTLRIGQAACFLLLQVVHQLGGGVAHVIVDVAVRLLKVAHYHSPDGLGKAPLHQ